MKKILLTATAVAALTTSSAYAAENNFYAKVEGGWSKLNNIKIKTVKSKAKNDGFAGVGIGYNIMNNFRADLTFSHFFNPTFSSINEDKKSKTNYKINTILLNGFVDLFDASVAKVFVGAGVGTAHINGKIKTTNLTTNTTASTKIKAKNYLSYAVYAGASAEVAPCVNAELTYSYRDFSKIKDSNKRLSAHQVGVGVRFDM